MISDHKMVKTPYLSDIINSFGYTVTRHMFVTRKDHRDKGIVYRLITLFSISAPWKHFVHNYSQAI